VKIGVIYPLTGNAASAGQSAKAAVTLGAEIVNNAHPELKSLPLGATAGLPNLGGAKIEQGLCGLPDRAEKVRQEDR